MAPDRKRTTLVAVRLAIHEFDMMKELADADGITYSDVLRLSLRREYERKFGAVKQAPAKKGRKG
jgi:hypothetical protein